MKALPAPAIYALGIAGSKLISLLSLPILARGLGPQGYGQLDVLVLMIDAMGLIMGFGLVDASQRFLAIRQRNITDSAQADILPVAHSVLVVTIAVTAVSAGIIVVILSELKFIPFESDVLLLATLAASGSAYLLMPMMLLRLHGHAVKFVKLGLTLAMCQSVCAVVSVQLGWGVRAILVSSALVHTCGAGLLALLFLRNFGWQCNTALTKQLFKYAWPIAVSGGAAFIFNGFERWWLIGSVSAQQLGSYSATWKLALLAIMATQAFQLWWSPRRMILITNGKHSDLIRFASLGVLWLTGVVISLSIIAPVVFPLLFGDEFLFDPLLCRLLLLVVLLRVAADILNAGCFIIEQPRAQMLIQLSTALITVLSLPYLVFTLGALGAALALVISSLFRLVAFYLSSQHYQAVAYPVLRLISIAVTMAIVSVFLSNSISITSGVFYSAVMQLVIFWIMFIAVIGLFFDSRGVIRQATILTRAGCHE